MSIGAVGKWKIYVVRSEEDVMPSKTFRDYTGHVYGFKVNGTLNKLRDFEGQFIDNPNDVDTRIDLAKNNLLYVMIGTKLLGKFVINKPVYGNDGFMKITGQESTGSQKQYRKIAQETMPKIKYDSKITCDILKSATSPQGILIDPAGDTILNLNSTFCGSVNERYTLQYDHENKIEALSKLASTTNQEWWLEHGTNTVLTPYSEGDSLAMANRMGSDVSTYTFHLGGTYQNCQISEGTEEIETQVDNVVVQGMDANHNQIVVEASDETPNWTTISVNSSLDGWLREDMDATQMEIPITANSFYSLRIETLIPGAGDYAIVKIDDERFIVIEYSAVADGYQLVIQPASRDITITGTEPTTHNKGADVIYASRYNGGIGSGEVRIYVDDTTSICDTYPGLKIFCIGNEPIFYCGYNTGYLCGVRSYSHVYAHGDKVQVKNGGWSTTCADNLLHFTSSPSIGETIIYDMTSNACAITVNGFPGNVLSICCAIGTFTKGSTVCGSPYGSGDVVGTLCMGYSRPQILNGLFSKTFSDNTQRNRHNLDLMAQGILTSKRAPIQRITMNVIDPIGTWGLVNMGDKVTIADGNLIGFSANQEVRITGFSFMFSAGEMGLEFYCNDPATRTYASNNINYVDESSSAQKQKSQDPVRKFTDENTTAGTSGGKVTTQQWVSFGMKQLKSVATPTENFDAANKKYVDANMGGSSLWRNSTHYVKLCDTTCCVCLCHSLIMRGTNNGTNSGLFFCGPARVDDDGRVGLWGEYADVIVGSWANNTITSSGGNIFGDLMCSTGDICAQGISCASSFYGSGSHLSGITISVNSCVGALNLVPGTGITIVGAGSGNITISSTAGWINYGACGLTPASKCCLYIPTSICADGTTGVVSAGYLTAGTKIGGPWVCTGAGGTGCVLTGTLAFNNCNCNKIVDTVTDIYINGRCGIYMNTTNAGAGMIICSNISTVRPANDGATDLGASFARWSSAFVCKLVVCNSSAAQPYMSFCGLSCTVRPTACNSIQIMINGLTRYINVYC